MKTSSAVTLVGLVGLVLTGCAASTSPPASTEPQPFLWRVTSPDRPGEVYVLGSVHLGQSGAQQMDDAIWDAVEAADVVVMEADVNDSESAMAMSQKLGILPEGETLADHVSPEVYAELTARLEELGLPVAGFDRLRPWLAAMSLLVLRLQLRGYSADQGVESLVRSRMEAGKELRYMESVEEQLRLFAELPPDAQQFWLQQGVRSTGADEEQVIEATISAYESGDLAQMERLLFEDLEEAPELRTRMFDDRNVRFAEYISGLLGEARVSLAVMGAGHVVGEVGVPRLLDEMGYRVERVAGKGRRPAPSGPVSWHRVEAPDYGFAAEFPSAPQASPMPGGRPGKVYQLDQTVVAFAILVFEIDDMGEDFADMSKAFFDKVLEAERAQLKGTVVEQADTPFDGLPRRTYLMHYPGGQVRGWLILDRGRVHQVKAVLIGKVGEGDQRAKAADRFFASFERVAASAEPAPAAAEPAPAVGE